jgi:hypothetical protein
MLFIGQDQASTAGYDASGYFPTPGGVTIYLAFYQFNRSSFPAYGILGQDMDVDSVDCYVDWGAGPMNSHKLAVRYPDSALSIGLNITEGGLASIVVGAYNAIWPGSL